jgi:hypothetical protein
VISTQANVNLSFLVLTDVHFRIHPANTHPDEKNVHVEKVKREESFLL